MAKAVSQTDPSLKVDVSVGEITDNANGTFDVPITIVVGNTGGVVLSGVQVSADLAETFPYANTFSVVTEPTLTAGLSTPAVNFDGNGQRNVLSGIDTLSPADSDSINFIARVRANDHYGPFTCTVNASANTPDGTAVTATGATPSFSFQHENTGNAPVRVEKPLIDSRGGNRRVRLTRAYSGYRSSENTILPGVYYEDDPALYGIGEYLIVNGYGEWYV